MNPQRLQWFSTLLPLRRTDRVLEIGCGSGHLLALLAEQRSAAGFRVQTTYHDQASRTFAVEWTALPRRARTGASA